jgi:hypothetical protein
VVGKEFISGGKQFYTGMSHIMHLLELVDPAATSRVEGNLLLVAVASAAKD